MELLSFVDLLAPGIGRSNKRMGRTVTVTRSSPAIHSIAGLQSLRLKLRLLRSDKVLDGGFPLCHRTSVKREVVVRHIGQVRSLCESWRRGELASRDFRAVYLAAASSVDENAINDDEVEMQYYDMLYDAAEAMSRIASQDAAPT